MAEEAAQGNPSIKPRVIGRYALFGEIAAGGMATVHFGRLVGPVGFSRTVAIKRLHPQFAKDPEFVAMFLDEARLASRIQHPNVVTTLDVVNMPNEVFLVMEYVQGESLSRLVRNAKKQEERMPPGHVAAIMSGMLHGLHAAHEAKSEKREPLNIVHRDISPQNVLVGVDGSARVLDFGVAKAALRSQSTRDGQMKGKLSYMSPEQLNGKVVDRRTDIFAAAVVLWEALCGRRLFEGVDAGEIFAKVLASEIAEPKSVFPDISDGLNRVVMKGLERDPTKRYQTARDFAIDLEGSIPLSTSRAVGEWVEKLAGPDLERRSQLVAEIEGMAATGEDLARFDEAEGLESVAPLAEHQSESAVQPISGSRPRIAPPAPPLPQIDPEERSASTGSSTSQVSSLAVPATALPTSARSSRATWVGALVACVGGGVLAFYLFGNRFMPAPVAPPAGVAPPAAAAPEAPQPPTVPPAETVQVEDLPTDTEDLEFENVQPGEATKDVKARSKRRSVKAPPAKPVQNCNPPFTFDAKGIRRLKPGCL